MQSKISSFRKKSVINGVSFLKNLCYNGLNMQKNYEMSRWEGVFGNDTKISH